MASRSRLQTLAVLAIIGVLFIGAGSWAPRAARANTTHPILLVVNNAAPNVFGTYLGEILRAEGITAFSTIQLEVLDAPTLNAAQLVILAETPLTSAQATLFNTYVASGGRLIAMRPDPQIAATLGLTPAGSNTNNGYIALNPGHPTSTGLPTTSLPFYGSAGNYTPAVGSATLAQLYSDRDTTTAYPAVVRYNNTAAWAFDLARSVAYSRQGNPANAGVDRDGTPPIRTTDIFYNAIDLERVAIPHADMQMRLFSRVITDMLADSVPLPRLWYFPEAKRTMLILTGDDHGQPAQVFQTLIANIEQRGGRFSIYGPRYAPNPNSTNTASWRATGHEVGLHPYAFADNVSFDQAMSINQNWFTQIGRGAPSRTLRMHQVEWQGWVDAASIMANYGIGMDTSFYTWGPSITRSDGSQVQGYITGSSLPMRFVAENGALLPVYQQATTLIDEALIGAIGSYTANLNTTQALEVTRDIIDASQAEHYAAITTQFHIDYYSFGEVQPWVHGTLDYAQSLNIPMWTAERWLNFTEARAAATMSALDWDANQNVLTFQVTIPNAPDAQSVMLPAQYAGQAFGGILVNGQLNNPIIETIHGRSMLFLSLGSGTHTISVRYDQNTPPLTATSLPSTPTSPPQPSTPTSTHTTQPTSTVQSGTPTNTPTTPPTGAIGQQAWQRVIGTCSSTSAGAVFGVSPTGCGGSGTSFDTTEIYDPSIIKDIASLTAPCPGIPIGSTCYRMWYTGEGVSNTYRIGYAVSPDGITWTRVIGPNSDGSVFGPGASGGFDRAGVAYPHVMKDGALFKLWYAGYGSDYIEGIGYATSSNGLDWTRMSTPVFTASGVNGTFDRDAINTPFVLKDRASALAPCPGIPSGDVCYRMWYEGVNQELSYIFRIGYAVSSDGINWIRVAGEATNGSVLDRHPVGFDEASLGVPSVIKEGDYYRMWYEGKSYQDDFAVGYATSTDGVHWSRMNPHEAVWTGADDPFVAVPDNVWSTDNHKDGAIYRMWYSASTQPNAVRIGSAQMVQGSLLSDLTLTHIGDTYTLSFTTHETIPANGSVLIALPAIFDMSTVTLGNLIGFQPGAAFTNEPAALSDAAAQRTTRGALLIRLNTPEAPGPKSVNFTLPNAPTTQEPVVVQSFLGPHPLEFGAIAFSGGIDTTPVLPTSTIPITPNPSGTPFPPTLTPTVSPSPPATATATPTALSTTADLVHTTRADFLPPCTLSTTTLVTADGDGAVGLDGAFSDPFSGPALDPARWVGGTWSSGTFTPTFSDDAILLTGSEGAYIRSQAPVSPRTLEAVASFGAGPWQHVGFGSADFAGDQYLLFSTFNGGATLFARSNNGSGEVQTNLGPLPAGFHTYRIEWVPGSGSDEVRYFVDGILRATHTVPALPPLYIYGSFNSGAAAPPLAIDALRLLPPYAPAGTFTSCPLDAGPAVSWTSATWLATVPPNTALQLDIRTSNDALTWTTWQQMTPAEALPAPARYAQYRLALSTDDTTRSPRLEQISFTRALDIASTPTNTPTVVPSPTNTPTVVPSPTNTPTAVPSPTNTPTNTVAPVTNSPTPTITVTLPIISVGLTNGGFEQDLDGNTKPDNWSNNTWFTTDPLTARSGAFAGKHQASNNANYTVSQQIEGITPGKGYRFEGWVNIPSTSDSFTFRVDVRWLNANSTSLGTTTIQSFNASTSGWRPIQRTAPLIAPSTATRAEVRMVLSSLAATVLVDDFSFANASLLTNGDFEIDLNGDNRPDAWTSSARFLRTTANVYNGTFAGRHNTTANASYTISQTITGISASNAYAFSGAIAIPPTTDTFAVTIDVQWRNSTNTVLGTTTVRSYTTSTVGWETFNQLLTPPPNTTRAVVRMTLNSLNGTIDVDTFAFE